MTSEQGIISCCYWCCGCLRMLSAAICPASSTTRDSTFVELDDSALHQLSKVSKIHVGVAIAWFCFLQFVFFTESTIDFSAMCQLGNRGKGRVNPHQKRNMSGGPNSPLVTENLGHSFQNTQQSVVLSFLSSWIFFAMVPALWKLNATMNIGKYSSSTELIILNRGSQVLKHKISPRWQFTRKQRVWWPACSPGS